jgi:hypothetical protein
MHVCQLCRAPIIGSYIQSPFGDSVCAQHGDPRQCANCLRFSSTSGAYCPNCLKTAIRDTGQMKSCVDSVLKWLNSLLGNNGLASIPATIGADDQFTSQCLGFTAWTSDGRTVTSQIFIRSEMPAIHCEQVLAHEYGHVLLVADPVGFGFTGGLDASQAVEEEGFCELLSYLYISQVAHPDRDRKLHAIRENTTPIYGEGFRRLWNRYEELGSLLAVRSELLSKSVTPYPTYGIPTPSGLGDPNQDPRFPISTTPDGGIQIDGGSHRPTIVISRGTPQPCSPAPDQPDSRPVIKW